MLTNSTRLHLAPPRALYVTSHLVVMRAHAGALGAGPGLYSRSIPWSSRAKKFTEVA